MTDLTTRGTQVVSSGRATKWLSLFFLACKLLGQSRLLVFLAVLACLLLTSCDYGITTPEPTVIATSAPDKATVKGILKDTREHKPVKDRLVLLAEVKQTGGAFPVAAIDPSSSLKFTTDEDGFFIISNVPPGEYALGMFLPIGYVLVVDPQNSKELLIDTTAGEVKDLGDVLVPPFP